jgi:uncharacterized protein YdcH (DUF465 family)
MNNHHPIVTEFPELKDKIHKLKIDSRHFRSLVHEYEGIDKSIVRAELGNEALSDAYLTELKKDRLNLKDLIYKMLTAG